MNTKTALLVSALLVTSGITIGVCVRKDRPVVTQLVGVPVRVADAPLPREVAPAVEPQKAVAQTEAPLPVVPETSASYTAKPGDTVSNVATGLLGADSKANRAAVIDASPSLQANPDLVVIGRHYDLTPKADPKPVAQAPAAPVAVEAPVVAAPVEPAPAEAPPAPVLKYTAAKGDTVTGLAGSLMGGDSKANRDAIVNANPSLQADPDHLLAGKAYRIVTPEGGLAAAAVPAVPAEPAAVRPKTQPDADTIVKASDPRILRYTAKAGDTVGSLALALLGSDNAANREIILNANASLKANPDMIIEGKTYWIPAPVAEVSAGN